MSHVPAKEVRENTVTTYARTHGILKSKSTSRKLIHLLGKMIAKEACKHTGGLEIPHVGTLRVSGGRYRTPDKIMSRKLNKIVYLKNINTGGLVFGFRLHMRPYEYKTCKKFVPSKLINIMLRDQIQERYTHFLIFSDMRNDKGPYNKQKGRAVLKRLKGRQKLERNIINRTSGDLVKKHYQNTNNNNKY